jgi:hypothetical protein
VYYDQFLGLLAVPVTYTMLALAHSAAVQTTTGIPATIHHAGRNSRSASVLWNPRTARPVENCEQVVFAKSIWSKAA